MNLNKFIHFTDDPTYQRLTAGLLFSDIDVPPTNPWFQFLGSVDDYFTSRFGAALWCGTHEEPHEFEDRAFLKRHCVWVDGPIGAGKTTLLRILKEIFGDDACFGFERAGRWTEEGILHEMYNDPEKLCDPFQRRAMEDAYLQTIEALYPPSKIAGEVKVPILIFIERGVPSQFILWPQLDNITNVLSEHTKEICSEILHNHARLFTMPESGYYRNSWFFESIHLAREPTVCIERIAKRGRMGEETVSADYLQKMNDALDNYTVNCSNLITSAFHKLDKWCLPKERYFEKFDDAWKHVRVWSDIIMESYKDPTPFTFADGYWWKCQDLDLLHDLTEKRLNHFYGTLKLCTGEKWKTHFPTLTFTKDACHLFFLPKIEKEKDLPMEVKRRPLTEEKMCVLQFTVEALFRYIRASKKKNMFLIGLLINALRTDKLSDTWWFPTPYKSWKIMGEFFDLPSKPTKGGDLTSLRETGKFFAYPPLRFIDFIKEHAYPEPPQHVLTAKAFPFISTELAIDEMDTEEKPILTYKKLSEKARTPTQGSPYAAGFDLFSAEDVYVPANSRALVKTDLMLKPPNGCYGRVAPRSGLSIKQCIDIGGGVIDPDYRGGVGIIVINNDVDPFSILEGDRIAQFICENASFPVLKEDNEGFAATERGSDGFGSTGI